MKILMYATGAPFTQPQTGGSKRFTELAKYLVENEECDICSADSDKSLGGLAINRKYKIEDNVANTYKFLPPEAQRLLKNRLILKKIKKHHYDCVISFDVPPTIGLCLFGIENIVLMVRKDLIGYEKVTSSVGKLKKIFKLIYLWICESICLIHAKKIIVQCNYDKEQILQRHRLIKSFVEKKIKIQINNINPSWIDIVNAKKQKSQNKLFYIGFIGNFNDARKGHDYLLPAAMNLVKKHSDIVFDIIGGGKKLDIYRKKYQHKRIIFYGRQNIPANLIMNCQLTIVPSLADSCPNTVLESLYYGIPVLGSNRGGIPEILKGCDNAIFDLSIEAIEKKLEYYYSHRDELIKLNISEKKRSEMLRFNWSERIYNKLIN